jgi:hypothetical protein
MRRGDAIDYFYALMRDLADRTGGPMHLTDGGLARACPKAGLYFFFENGEFRTNGEPRVVRVGTHGLTATGKATLWGRLRQHRGSIAGSHPGGGNHRGSIFRRHIGAALLSQRPAPELLASWLANDPHAGRRNAEREVEVEVSGVIRAMPFLWLNVPTLPNSISHRGFLERNLIALLSTLTGSAEGASPEWLGHDAVAPKVRASSLWNVNHVDETFDPEVLDVLQAYVQATPQAALSDRRG